MIWYPTSLKCISREKWEKVQSLTYVRVYVDFRSRFAGEANELPGVQGADDHLARLLNRPKSGCCGRIIAVLHGLDLSKHFLRDARALPVVVLGSDVIGVVVHHAAAAHRSPHRVDPELLLLLLLLQHVLLLLHGRILHPLLAKLAAGAHHAGVGDGAAHGVGPELVLAGSVGWLHWLPRRGVLR